MFVRNFCLSPFLNCNPQKYKVNTELVRFSYLYFLLSLKCITFLKSTVSAQITAITSLENKSHKHNSLRLVTPYPS
jgi:hypothetical protein